MGVNSGNRSSILAQESQRRKLRAGAHGRIEKRENIGATEYGVLHERIVLSTISSGAAANVRKRRKHIKRRPCPYSIRWIRSDRSNLQIFCTTFRGSHTRRGNTSIHIKCNFPTETFPAWGRACEADTTPLHPVVVSHRGTWLQGNRLQIEQIEHSIQVAVYRNRKTPRRNGLFD